MARNGTGTYVLPAGQPVVTSTTISSTVFNTFTSDIATAITQSVCTDGQTPMTATLSMGIHKISNLTDGVLSTDASSVGQLTTAVLNAKVSIMGRNYIDNGSMRIAQRASSFSLTTSATYGSLDRWFGYMGATAAGTFSQSAISGIRSNVARIGRNNASTSTGVITCGQVLETAESKEFAGRTAIFSFLALAGANFSGSGSLITVKLYSGTGTDQSSSSMTAGTWTSSATPISTTQALTTSMTKYTFTAAIPITVTQLGVQLSYTPSGTAGFDDNLYFTEVQLEQSLNSDLTASTYEHTALETELARCKRHFEKSYNSTTTLGSVTLLGSEQSTIATAFILSSGRIRFSTEKRANPTLTLYSPNSGTSGSVAEYNSGGTFVADRGASGAGGTGTTGAFIQVGGTGTIGNDARWHWAASAEL